MSMNWENRYYSSDISTGVTFLNWRALASNIGLGDIAICKISCLEDRKVSETSQRT